MARYNGHSWSQPACPTAEQVFYPGRLLAQAAPSFVKGHWDYPEPNDAAEKSMTSAMTFGVNAARDILCDIMDNSYRSYTCKREVYHSAFTIFVTSITVLGTVHGFLFSAFAEFYGPDAHEPDDNAVKQIRESGSAMELKSTSSGIA
jgi:hypothetical protein